MNINDTVRVRLTELARSKQGDDYWSDAEKSGEWQLWRLMQVFGPHIHMGMVGTLFEGNEIDWAREQLEEILASVKDLSAKVPAFVAELAAANGRADEAQRRCESLTA
jgi:hypothetical protein